MKKKKDKEKKINSSQGQALEIQEIELWNDPVDIDELLNELVSMFGRYTVLPG